MTFRQLGWRQLAEAEEARSATVLRNLRNMGGELLRDLPPARRMSGAWSALERQLQRFYSMTEPKSELQ